MVIRAVIRGWAISAVCAVGLVFGCAGADDISEDEVSRDEVLEEELSTAEQEIILPIEEPAGPAQQCVPACIRFDVSGAVLGHCCVCNGVAKVFKRATFNANIYLCQ
jgi:hypothetical protein